MAAIILVWDPEHWNRWNYSAAVDQVAATGLYAEPWDTGADRILPAGTEAWLLLQGHRQRGLIGHGVVASAQPGPAEPGPPLPGHSPAPPVRGAGTASVVVVFDALLPLGDQIGVDRTGVGVFNGTAAPAGREGTHGPALDIGPSEEAKVRALWSRLRPGPGPDPRKPAPGTYPEKAVSRIPVNRYEHDPEALRACIAHHGTGCAACGFSFEITYGAIGRDFVDVHHVVPVSQLGSGYELDPVTDLVPLCANCHTMAHHGTGTPRTVAELRRLIAASGFLSGATVTAPELEAEREARRMLGP